MESFNVCLTWAVRLAGKAEYLLAEVLPLVFGEVAIAGQQAAALQVAGHRVKGPADSTSSPGRGHDRLLQAPRAFGAQLCQQSFFLFKSLGTQKEIKYVD